MFDARDSHSHRGGSGKTVTATALVHDPLVRLRFEKIVFLPFGQTPVLRDLQKLCYFQLVKKNLDVGFTSEEVQEALRDAAKGKTIIIVLDDVWTKNFFQPFSRVLDDSTTSCLVVTTRVKGLVPGASEFELGLLSPDDSVSLLLECAGETSNDPPYSEILYSAVELCGHLPLIISIAAGILEGQHGGVVDESFIELLSSENKEVVLRVGDYGDELVSVEDRLITASLNSYTGKDKEQVEEMFYNLAVSKLNTAPLAFFFSS